MSIKNWNAGIIRPVPVAPAGPYQNSAASGTWTLDQAAYWQKQGLWPIPGNINPALFIENLFSTYLYTGNDSTQTITNGIDLAGKGGLIWLKKRNNTSIHGLWDTVRGGGSRLDTSSTAAASSVSPAVTFNSNGFTLPAGGSSYLNESSANTYVSWTFREQAKFFDVVTYTGDGVAGRTVPHNLGSVPGVIIVKLTTSSQNWRVYHRALGATQYLELDGTGAAATLSTIWNNTAPTSTVFSVGTNSSVNNSGSTYVAYLFAHDAGGFGLTGADNVISCGSFTTDGSGNATVTLGYEPQFVIWKKSSAAGAWNMQDVMRGMPVSGDGQFLEANVSAAEYGASQPIRPSATGFYGALAANANSTYIYIAIRRGPMKTPTTGTSVFTPTTYTGNGTSQIESAGFPTDMAIITNRGAGGGYERNVGDRLRGGNRNLFTTLTVVENTATNRITAFDNMVGVAVGSDGDVNQSSGSQIAWNFRRAPGFFDEVCYSGSGSTQNISHNLAVVPELMIFKARNSAQSWPVYSATLGIGQRLFLNGDAPPGSTTHWPSAPTSSVFSVAGGDLPVNANTVNYVAYLFASCPGVSKVGSYVGNGSSQTIPCGFTGGARFVLIKRTDSTGGWYVWDSARGIVAGNDPYLLLNSTAAEVTTNDSVDTDSTGFVVNQVAATNVNVTSAAYIFLAIA